MMNKKVDLKIDKFDVIDDYSDDQLAIVEVYVCHDGNNLHDMPIDLSVIKKAKKTLRNKFLVAGYDGEDFEGHEPDEQIVGFFPESSEMKFVEKDGRTYLVAQAIMSKIYANWAYEIFLDEENNRAVSMEITVLALEVKEDGLEHITKFVFNGVTLLGKSHLPACEGANASIIKFSSENALKFYSKRLKHSNEIKKNFMKDIVLAENLRKEESEKMEEKETKVVDEEMEKDEEKKKEEEKEQKENMEKENSDETTYMDEDGEEEKEDKEDEEDNEEDKEDDEEKEEKKFESLTVEQKYEVFRSAVKESIECAYLESFDEEYLYVFLYDECYTFRYAYTLDGTNCTIDLETKTRVMRGGYVEFEKYEAESSEIENLKNENCELKNKVLAYETAEKAQAVETILAGVVDILSAEDIAEFRNKAENYNLENLSVFENEVKAFAFEAMKEEKNEQKQAFEKMPINQTIKITSKYGW